MPKYPGESFITHFEHSRRVEKYYVRTSHQSIYLKVRSTLNPICWEILVSKQQKNIKHNLYTCKILLYELKHCITKQYRSVKTVQKKLE